MFRGEPPVPTKWGSHFVCRSLVTCDRRWHGEPLPLPTLSQRPSSGGGASRRLRRQRNQDRALTTRVNESIKSVNALSRAH
eukprot:11807195-Heterocapsa_arctica.AAC.1